MVKKLLKYELLHYIRALLPFELIVLVVAFFSRIIQIFDNGSQTYDIVFYSSVVMFVISILLCLVMCFVTAITRYYKNFFTAEGYLTMTLPVTGNQHILSKWITAFLSVFASMIVVLFSVCVCTFGEPLFEILKAIGYLYKRCYQYTGFTTIFLTIEGILTACIAVFYMLMLFYSCITIGQLAKKNRILASFGVYFGYYLLTQILGTIFLILMTTTNVFNNLFNWIGTLNGDTVWHLIFGGVSLVSLILSSVLYFVCKNIIYKHLNLE